jgi:DNA-binding transcriptional MerR regulator
MPDTPRSGTLAKGARPAAGKAAAARADAPREKAGKTYTITELALEFDITPRAIRFYEDVGLLTPARAGRNRVYTPGDRTRLKLTLRGKRLGLSLNEIKQLVHMYDSEADNRAQLEAFLGVLQDHRVQLEQQRDDIQVTLEEIAQHEERCRRLIAQQARSEAATAKASPARRKAAKA